MQVHFFKCTTLGCHYLQLVQQSAVKSKHTMTILLTAVVKKRSTEKV